MYLSWGCTMVAAPHTPRFWLMLILMSHLPCGTHHSVVGGVICCSYLIAKANHEDSLIYLARKFHSPDCFRGKIMHIRAPETVRYGTKLCNTQGNLRDRLRLTNERYKTCCESVRITAAETVFVIHSHIDLQSFELMIVPTTR